MNEIQYVDIYGRKRAISNGCEVDLHWSDLDSGPIASVSHYDGGDKDFTAISAYVRPDNRTPEEFHAACETAIRRVAYLVSIDLEGV